MLSCQYRKSHLGDNDRGCAGVVCEAPEGSGRMMQSKPELSEGFDVIIRPEPEGASQTTPKQPGHYSHYNTKLTNTTENHRNPPQILALLSVVCRHFVCCSKHCRHPPYRFAWKILLHTLTSDYGTKQSLCWVRCEQTQHVDKIQWHQIFTSR